MPYKWGLAMAVLLRRSILTANSPDSEHIGQVLFPRHVQRTAIFGAISRHALCGPLGPRSWMLAIHTHLPNLLHCLAVMMWKRIRSINSVAVKKIFETPQSQHVYAAGRGPSLPQPDCATVSTLQIRGEIVCRSKPSFWNDLHAVFHDWVLVVDTTA